MTFSTTNPATEEPIQSYQLMSREEVFSIIQASHQAFQSWRNLSFKERASHLRSLAAVLRQNKEEYARFISLEMGKPLKEARAEVEKCAWTAEIYADNGPQWLEEELLTAEGKEHRVVFQPLGVIFSIMPWNFPFWQALRFAIPALVAGNTAILKHATNVTGCALLIEDAFKKAGFPQNIFRTIIADHTTAGEVIASNLISGVSLTGSTIAGARIAELAGKNLKKVVLELGGSDPFIVLDDADIDIAARNAATGRFLNCGQTCIAAKRLIVMESVADEFTRKFIAHVQQKKIGDPFDETTDIGPLVTEKSLLEVQEQVQETLAAGALLALGGKRIPRKGYFFEPTILTNVTPSMRAAREEVFGPVAPIIVVKTEAEAVQVANNSEFGLGGSIWTRDLKRGEQVARQLECGCAFVNSVVRSDPRLPFGGVKKSGLGRELSKYGLREFVNVKAINIFEGK